MTRDEWYEHGVRVHAAQAARTQPSAPISDILVPDDDLLLPWGADRSTVRGRIPRREPSLLGLLAITAGIAMVTPILLIPTVIVAWLVFG